VLLGYAFGASAREVIDRAKGPAVVAIVALLAVGAVVWLLRRGRRGGVQAWSEACCPACLAIGALGGARADRDLAQVAVDPR
jgi:hypothetical protein